MVHFTTKPPVQNGSALLEVTIFVTFAAIQPQHRRLKSGRAEMDAEPPHAWTCSVDVRSVWKDENDLLWRLCNEQTSDYWQEPGNTSWRRSRCIGSVRHCIDSYSSFPRWHQHCLDVDSGRHSRLVKRLSFLPCRTGPLCSTDDLP